MKFFVDGAELLYDGNRGVIVTNDTPAVGQLPDVEDDDFAVPGFIGATYVPGSTHGATVFPLAVTVVGTDYADAYAQLVVLDRALAQRYRLVEVRRVKDGLDVSAQVKRIASTDPKGIAVGNAALATTYALKIPAGRWLDTSASVATLTAGTQTVTDLLGGSAPMAAEFALTGYGPNTSYTITDVTSGAWFRLAGDLTPGVQVTVDPAALTVTGGAEALLTWGDAPMYVSPEAVIDVARNGTHDITMTARRGFYE